MTRNCLNKGLFSTATAVLLCLTLGGSSPTWRDLEASHTYDIVPAHSKRLGPALIGVALFDGFIEIVTDIWLEAVPGSVTGGEFGGAVAGTMFGKMNADKPWVCEQQVSDASSLGTELISNESGINVG